MRRLRALALIVGATLATAAMLALSFSFDTAASRSASPIQMTVSLSMTYPAKEDGTRDMLQFCEEKCITQELDHFRANGGGGTFEQRYFFCGKDNFDAKIGAIFFYLGNEADATLYVNNTGLMWENAKEFGALIVFAEHRYFGKSLPFGVDVLDHMEFLSVAQALVDYAVLVEDIKDKLNADVPVIGFGGSYGGILCTWFRLEYPHLVDGVIAASAPILAFMGDKKHPVDSEGFQRGVAFNMSEQAGSATHCVPSVRRAFATITKLGKTASGRQELADLLRVCESNPLDSEESVSAIVDAVIDVYGNLAMGNYPYSTSYITSGASFLPAYPMRAACEHMKDEFAVDDRAGLLAAFRESFGVFLNNTKQETCFFPHDPPSLSKAVEINAEGNFYSYIERAELHAPFSRDNVHDPFPAAPVDLMQDGANCFSQWQVRVRLNWAVTEFGSTKALHSTSNIVFSNGRYDPWSMVGISASISDSVVYLPIDESAHHLDLFFTHPQDPPAVTHARRVEKQHIRTLIDEFYTKKAAARSKLSMIDLGLFACGHLGRGRWDAKRAADRGVRPPPARTESVAGCAGAIRALSRRFPPSRQDQTDSSSSSNRPSATMAGTTSERSPILPTASAGRSSGSSLFNRLRRPRTWILLSGVALVVATAVIFSLRVSSTSDARVRTGAPFAPTVFPAKEDGTRDMLQFCEEKFITQELDHFRANGGGDSFEMRYFVCAKENFNPKNGSIFFYVGNEADVTLYLNNTGLMWENAKAFNALIVFAEHRYFGKSIPFGDKVFDHMEYLASTQALADYAVLIEDLKDTMNIDVPVIGFGGSYGGMLGTWFRTKYPHVVDGVIAGSAPVLAFLGDKEHPVDSEGFLRVVTYDMSEAAGSAPNCIPNVRRVIVKLREIGKTDAGRKELATLFKLCDPNSLATEADVEGLVSSALGAYGNLAMGNYPYPSSYITSGESFLPAYPVRASCEFLRPDFAQDDYQGLLAAFRESVGVFYNSTKKESCYFPTESPSNVTDINIKGNLWGYLECSELYMPMGSDGIHDVFPPAPANETADDEACFATWGVHVRPRWANTLYGGVKALRATSNIVFSQGTFDPWSATGVTETLSDSVVYVPIEGGAHHLDLFFTHPLDPPAVTQARQLELQHIQKWIAEFYAVKAGN